MEKEANKLSPEELHSRQTWLEIWLPLILCLTICAGVIVLIILAAVGGSGSIAQLSAISIIFMTIPVLVLLLFTIALTIVVNYFLIKGNRVLPHYGRIAREKVSEITGKIQEVLLSFITGILKIQSIFEAVIEFFTPGKPQEMSDQEKSNGK